VTEGRTGLFFDPFDPEAAATLAARIRSVKADPSWAAQLAEEGHREVHRCYTWDRVGAKLEAIYREAEETAKARY
jgi:glycosyltransferase involved in cell wall biosynthesis